MGNITPVAARPAVPSGVTRICVMGFSSSHNVGRAANLAAAIASAHPHKYETWFYFSNRGFRSAFQAFKEELSASDKAKSGTLDSGKSIGDQTSAPFVWFERDVNGKKVLEAIGGRDMFAQWAGKEFIGEESIQKFSSIESPPLKELFSYETVPTYNK